MWRRLKLPVLAIAVVATLAAVIVTAIARASLPRRAGSAAIAGLGDSVRIELDVHAIPRIRAASIEDAFRAQGFIHAQERFFQMDLIRRSAAGELSALVGARAQPLDLREAPFEFRRRARAQLARLPARHRAWLEAYAEGVNAGLADLGAKPPEYWLLGGRPEPWRAEDSLLTVFAIYTMLSNNEYYERSQAVMAATLPASVFSFLTPTTSRYDRPLLASADDTTGGYVPAAIPPAAVVDLRDAGAAPPAGIVDPPLMGQAASNQWAVDAHRTAAGTAILANDPHLGFQLPNLFYRVEIHTGERVARGVSVPGLPGVLIGANESLAWGATVSYADQSDWVVIEPDPTDPDRYLTPDGYERVDRVTVTVGRGDAATAVDVRRTRYGPIVGEDGLGRPLALKATWLEPDGMSLDLLELAFAESLPAALSIIERWAGPSLSWSLADADGHIAWIVNGPIPERIGFDGATPVAWGDGAHRWAGYRQPPRLDEPRDGFVFNANNRPLPMPAAAAMGRVFMRPHRAARIADLLADSERLTETDLFRMQLDTTADAYEPLRRLVLEVVRPDESEPLLAAAREQALRWNGRADAEEPAFLTLQRFFRALLGRLIAPLLAPASAADPAFVYRWPLAEETMLRIVETRPAHLLPHGFADWNEFLRAILLDALEAGTTDIATPWGVSNQLAVGHPLAALPLIGHWLRAPADPQAGSPVSIRVATPSRGAVFRMVVSPAQPERGILQLFGGQSGHFLSPNFIDQHAAWAGDVPAPFLAGPTVDAYRLSPQ